MTQLIDCILPALLWASLVVHRNSVSCIFASGTQLNYCSMRPYEQDQCHQSTRTSWWNKVEQLLGPYRQGHQKRNALTCDRWLWPDGKVPFDNQLIDSNSDARLKWAIGRLEENSCVRFRPRQSWDIRFLTIVQEQVAVCKATLGSSSVGPLLVLGSDCSPSQTLHELMHVLGFAHEHSRPDRDQFIRINCSNIVPRMRRNFRRFKPSSVRTFGVPYDFDSIMHYPLDRFSINGRLTIEPLPSVFDTYPDIDLYRVGRTFNLSRGDVYGLNQLYRCV